MLTALKDLRSAMATFYGPGTVFSLDGNLVNLVRKRRMPVIGEGRESGASSTSMTPRPPQSRQRRAARPVSATSLMTNQRQSQSGSPNWAAH
jgi:hypothetical protein